MPHDSIEAIRDSLMSFYEDDPQRWVTLLDHLSTIEGERLLLRDALKAVHDAYNGPHREGSADAQLSALAVINDLVHGLGRELGY